MPLQWRVGVWAAGASVWCFAGRYIELTAEVQAGSGVGPVAVPPSAAFRAQSELGCAKKWRWGRLPARTDACSA